MGVRFRKSIKIGKNTRVNLSKSGIGLSTGAKGARVSVNQKGTRTTLSAPGTGLSYVSYKSHGSQSKDKNFGASQDMGERDKSLKVKTYKKWLIALYALITAIFFFTGHKILGAIGIFATLYIIGRVSSEENKAYILYNKAIKATNEEDKINLLKEAKIIDNNNDLVNAMLAYTHFEKKDNQSTIQYISDINDFSKLNAHELERMLIISLFENKEYDKIISNYESEIETDLFKKLMVALSYKGLGKVKKASEMLATGPINKRAYDDTVLSFKYELGLCYLEMGEREKAERQLRKVYEIDSSFEDIVKYAKELGFALGEHLE